MSLLLCKSSVEKKPFLTRIAIVVPNSPDIAKVLSPSMPLCVGVLRG